MDKVVKSPSECSLFDESNGTLVSEVKKTYSQFSLTNFHSNVFQYYSPVEIIILRSVIIFCINHD